MVFFRFGGTLGVTGRILVKIITDSVDGIMMTDPNENPDPLRLLYWEAIKSDPKAFFTKGQTNAIRIYRQSKRCNVPC